MVYKAMIDRTEKLSRYGSILIVSGPSGVGKSTICGAVRAELPELRFSISCTTRDPRPGESDGKDYFFISRDEFEKKIAAGEFIEYAEVFGNYYGTLQSEVVKYVKAGHDVFLDIDIQGAMQILEYGQHDELIRRCCETIFIMPPSVAVLEQRLRARATESEETMRQRLAKAEYELSFWPKYNYLVINDDLQRAIKQLRDIVLTAGCQTKRYYMTGEE